MAARQADAGNERILRRESVRLFGQSKRLEKLTPWLDLLLTNDLASSGLMPQETWALLDLRREPQPFLVAGSGTVTLLDGMQLPLARPFLGLPSEAISGFSRDTCKNAPYNLFSLVDSFGCRIFLGASSVSAIGSQLRQQLLQRGHTHVGPTRA